MCGSIHKTEEEILTRDPGSNKICLLMIICPIPHIWRAKEDYLIGNQFFQTATLQYGRAVSNFQNSKYTVISVGRVMTCVLAWWCAENVRSELCEDTILSGGF